LLDIIFDYDNIFGGGIKLNEEEKLHFEDVFEEIIHRALEKLTFDQEIIQRLILQLSERYPNETCGIIDELIGEYPEESLSLLYTIASIGKEKAKEAAIITLYDVALRSTKKTEKNKESEIVAGGDEGTS
jgi:hypothetical protein